MANESPTLPQLSHGSCRSSEGRMTACPPDQRRPLRRVFDEEVSLAQHVGHDTAVDDRLSWRAADFGAALERLCTQIRYTFLSQNSFFPNLFLHNLINVLSSVYLGAVQAAIRARRVIVSS